MTQAVSQLGKLIELGPDEILVREPGFKSWPETTTRDDFLHVSQIEIFQFARQRSELFAVESSVLLKGLARKQINELAR